MSFTKIHEVVINKQSYYIHKEIVKYCHYFNTILKGEFQEKTINLELDMDNFDFNIIINIFYRYHLCLEDCNGAKIQKRVYIHNFDGYLYENLLKTYQYFFAYHNCSFKELIIIVNILDFLQSNIKIKDGWKQEYNLSDVLINSYVSEYKLNHNEIINANIDIGYKKKLMEFCMGKLIKRDDYSRYIFGLDIEELNDKFYCKNLGKYFEYYGVPLKFEFRDYHIEHRVEIDLGIDNMSCDEYEFDELEATLYINDEKIREVCKRSSINSDVNEYIINYLIDVNEYIINYLIK
ncbi:hypothetical protein Klosneuvirus_1_311 [Klosneuvirus KNV1]|uniref:BTB domain-containing protein n=1 Tax=Klosneuvirus KNV1 TaxID=1977640 RepID=A0A1V0SII9_9VIRU|nr:hypothetical protein Klosneuvirus_1_311 [Klosneuvirus KNV1]